MDAQNLFLSDGREAGAAYCGKCKTVYRALNIAEKCCKNYICDACGVDTGERYYTRCRECREKADRQKELERFNKATKVENWDGPVHSYAHDKYWESLGDFYNSVYNEYDQFEDIPDYLYCCKDIPAVNIDLGNCIDHIEMPEGYDDYKFKGCDEFKKAIEAFNDANKGLRLYDPDLSQVVLIDKSQIDASYWDFDQNKL